MYCHTIRTIRPAVKSKNKGMYAQTRGSVFKKVLPCSKNMPAKLSQRELQPMQIKKMMAVSIRATASRIFHTLGLKKLTGLARIKMPANINSRNSPTKTSLIMSFGQQVTITIQMMPKQRPKSSESKMTSIEFRIEFLIEIWGWLQIWSDKV